MKGQIAIEYIIIVGFVLVVINIFLLAYFQYSESSTKEIELLQISKITKKLVNSAENVNAYGVPSKTTLTAYFPNNIQNITFQNGILFIYKSKNGLSYISESSLINITGDISPGSGIKHITIKATSEGAEIMEE